MVRKSGEPQKLKRPFTREECRQGPRPCPWVSCRYHLYLDIDQESGRLRLNFPNKELWELEVTCALDVAEQGEGCTCEEISRYLNLTGERVRQMTFTGVESVGHRLFPNPSDRDS